ncbi:MAG: hypothetical protein ACYC5F_05260 [Thermoleophilia bacterium]
MTSVGCGNSISNTPEQAVNDYFQSINDKNCEKHIELTSHNLFKPGTNYAEELQACQQSVEGEHPFITVKIDEVSTGENRAVAKGELTMSTKNKQTNKIIVRLIVEDGEWKLDKIIANAPSQPPT